GQMRVSRGGQAAVSKEKVDWASFGLPAGKAKVYVFEFDTAVPLSGFDYSMKDDAGKDVAADSSSDKVHRIAVESDAGWAANVEVSPAGWHVGSVTTSTIQPGKFRVYVEASSERF